MSRLIQACLRSKLLFKAAGQCLAATSYYLDRVGNTVHVLKAMKNKLANEILEFCLTKGGLTYAKF